MVSGRGTNLQALVAAASQPGYPAEVVAVASNRPSCPALKLAHELGLATRAFPAAAHGGSAELRDQEMASWLLERGCSLLVLAGYDRILSAPLLAAFPQRILNLHNSLLPAFSGTMNAVEQALAHGVKVTGCTVHLVDPELVDGGPIVLQAAVEVSDDDTPDTLLARIHEQEWRVLPEAVRLMSLDQIRVEGRRVLRAGS
ncbi:MAG: phosphoribosylglycinamide formyltransferase [Candidatus Dormibacteria bacterium]